MRLDHRTGVIAEADFVESPNQDLRTAGAEPECIIIHCISLPPGKYGGGAIRRLFLNQLSATEHPYYRDIAQLEVSAHFLIERDGSLSQFVPTHKRAWHAGESVCLGRPKVNDFSIGIELEGLDTDPHGFTDQQYSVLRELVAVLMSAYPKMEAGSLFGHSDIAPGRKTDPGPYFNWARVLADEPS